MNPTKNAAAYVGRIGALAVALGVGAAMTTGTAVAWADTSDSGSSSRSSSSSSSTSGGSAAKTRSDTSSSRTKSSTATTAPSGATNRSTTKTRDDSKATTKPGSRAGTKADQADDTAAEVDETVDDTPATETDTTTTPPPVEPETETPPVEETEAPSRGTAAAPVRSGKSDRSTDATQVTTVPDLTTAVRAAAVQPDALTERLEQRTAAALESVQEAVTATMAATAGAVRSTRSAAEASAAPIVVVVTDSDGAPLAEERQPSAQVVSSLLAAVGLAPMATGNPLAPVNSSPLLALLGWARRETDRNITPAAGANTVQSGQIITAAAVVEPLPRNLASERVGWVTGPGVTNGFNIGGTDLGIMWDAGVIDGQRVIHLAFGDTFKYQDMTGDWRNNVLLISSDRNLNNGLDLWQTGPAFQFIPKNSRILGLFGSEVTVIPTAGINADGRQLVNYMSVRSWDTPGRWTTNYSAISRFEPGPNGGEWVLVPSTIRSAGWFKSSTRYVAGSQNFQQMAYVLQPEDQIGEDGIRYVYAFGTPSGRAGSAHLSRVAEGSMTDLSQYEYWDGNKWVKNRPAVATAIIGDSKRSTGLFGFVKDWANNPNVFGGYLGGLFGAKTGGNVSEMSVQYNEYLGKYVVLYGDGRNNVQMRIADTPESQWSDPITIATSAQYPGLYAPMIHPWSGTGLLTDGNGNADRSSLYWNMSLWGPYNVVLMQTDLSELQTIQV